MPKVTFTSEVITVEARDGQTIREVAQSAGIELERGLWRWAHCRGLGFCGACKVWVKPLAEGAVSPKDGWEKTKSNLQGTARLGCRARVRGDVEVATLPGGKPIAQNPHWAHDPRPSRWKDRTAGKEEAAPPVAPAQDPKAVSEEAAK